MRPSRGNEINEGRKLHTQLSATEHHRNLTLAELAEIFDEPLEKLAYWVVLGMPGCTDLDGTYDFRTCMYWRIGHTLSDHKTSSNTPLNSQQLTVAGWLLSPGFEANTRHQELASFIDDMQRTGCSAISTLATLSEVMTLFHHLNMYPTNTVDTPH